MRRLFNVMVALALALGVNALAINVAPVMAHDTTCNAGYFCVWQHSNYTGADHEHFISSANDWNFFGIENDDDSVKNKETVRVRVFNLNGWSGPTLYCVLANGAEDDIAGDRDDQGDSSLLGSNNSCSGYPSP